MLPETVNGLPVHPLVVHAVVVLLPLAALSAVAIVVRPSWRRAYGPLVLAAAVLATLAIPIATSSGEDLEHRVGDPGEHAELGDTLIWFAIPLVVGLAALVWLDRRTRSAAGATTGQPPAATHWSRRASTVLATSVLVALVAVANLVQVVRVGDSGARAAWGDTPASQRR